MKCYGNYFPTPHSKLLEDEGNEVHSQRNYFLTPGRNRGWFVLDLGCEKYVTGVRLRLIVYDKQILILPFSLQKYPQCWLQILLHQDYRDLCQPRSDLLVSRLGTRFRGQQVSDRPSSHSGEMYQARCLQINLIK